MSAADGADCTGPGHGVHRFLISATMKSSSNFLEWAYQSQAPIRTLWRWLDCGWWRSFYMVAIFAIKQSPAWGMPLIIGLMIDWVSGEPGATPPLVLFGISVQLLLLAANIPLHTYYISMLSRLTRQLEMRLRRALVTRLQQLSIRYYDDNASGRLQTKVLRDVEQVQLTAHQLGEFGVMALTSIVALVVITATKQPLVLLVYLTVLPLALGLTRIFQGKIRPVNRYFRQSLEEMNTEVSQMIEMIPMSRAHAVEDSATERVDEKFDRVRYRGGRLDRVNALFQASSWVTFQLANLLMFGVGIWFAFEDLISVGDVVLFQALFTQMLMTITMLLTLYPQFAKGMESVRSIGEVLECPDMEHNQGKQEVASVQGNIRFDGVSFYYAQADTPALRGIDLDIPAGQSVAIIGPSGGGKSTLVRLAIGFRRPTAGRIYLDGIEMEQIDMRSWRKFISVVPQEAILFEGTIKENILFGSSDCDEARLEEILRAANVREFVDRLPDGLETRIGESGARLSGGQRQRLAIARALVRDPRVIFLDEPTSALDVVSEKLVQEAIERLIKGRTTVIVAHRLSTIRHADRVVVMEAGEIVERGTYQELANRPGSAFGRMKDLQS
jgi:ATP-binding cassette, subfamily B, bacterial